jgi:hypothetical protein
MGRPLQEAMLGQQQQIESLRRTVATQNVLIDYIANLAGISSHVTAIRKKADVENPAQPVPNPPSEQAYETTEQALAPAAYDNPQAIGQTPGSVNNVPADTTDVALAPGESLPTSPYNQLDNVQAPIAGTETQLPLEQTRTEVDVRVGDPMNPQPAYPWTLDGGQQRASSNRTMASLHLARLRMQAGVAGGSTDDLSVAASIESDAALSDNDIEKEISTLAKVTAAASQSQSRPANLVPRSASGVRRTTPSLASAPSGTNHLASASSVGDDTKDADLFE